MERPGCQAGSSSARVHEENGVYAEGRGFKSLLSAMWLQMLWLIRSEPRHCLWCKNVLPANARSDMRFCNNGGRCRAKWTYHNGGGKSSKKERKRTRDGR